MRAFTEEQWGVLEAMNRLYKHWFEAQQQRLEDFAVEIATLKGVVIQKGLVSEDELEEWVKEAKVFAQAETAVSAQLQSLEDDFNRLRLNAQASREPGAGESDKRPG